jgi:hypothetical protein
VLRKAYEASACVYVCFQIYDPAHDDLQIASRILDARIDHIADCSFVKIRITRWDFAVTRYMWSCRVLKTFSSRAVLHTPIYLIVQMLKHIHGALLSSVTCMGSTIIIELFAAAGHGACSYTSLAPGAS